MHVEDLEDALRQMAAAQPAPAAGARAEVGRRVKRRTLRNRLVVAAVALIVVAATAALLGRGTSDQSTSLVAGVPTSASSTSVATTGSTVPVLPTTLAIPTTSTTPTTSAVVPSTVLGRASTTSTSTRRSSTTRPVATTAAPITTTSTTTAEVCGQPPGSATDLSAEPPYNIPADAGEQLRAWTDRAGCTVRRDVLALFVFDAGFHCAPSPNTIRLGYPLGQAYTASSIRTYVHEPPNGSWVSTSAPDGYAAHADLPAAATDTGYQIDGTHLFMVPGSDTYVWMVSPTATERWPLGVLRACI